MIYADIIIRVAETTVWTGTVPLNVAMGLVEVSGIETGKKNVSTDTKLIDKK